MSQYIGDSMNSPVDPDEFAKMASAFGEVNWRPLSAAGAPGWPEGTLPHGNHFAALRNAFRKRGMEFYGAASRLSLLGGIFQRQDQLQGFISITGGYIIVSDALLRAAAVCAIVDDGNGATFDYADLVARAHWFARAAGGGRRGGAIA